MKYLNTESGLSLIATVLALLLFSLFIAVAVSLVTTGASIGLQEEQGVQALFIADGGLHYSLALNKLNIPNYSTYGQWHDLGAGEFKVDTPAYLTSPVALGNTSISVDSTDSFPATGRITIDSEFIQYTGKNDLLDTFTVPAGEVKQTHNQYNSVYPAARITTTINAADCTTLPIIGVADDTEGFDIKRPFFIDTEYFLCDTKTQYQFQNCQRCYAGSSKAAHPAGGGNSYASQYILTSTGRITNIIASNVQRVVRISAGPKED